MGRDTRRCDPCGHPGAQVAGSSPPLHRHPARKSQGPVPRCTVTLRASRRVQSPAAPSPCAKSQGPVPRCAVTLREVAGSSPPLHRHPARSRRVQSPAAPSPCAQVAGSSPPLRRHPARSRRVQPTNRVVQRFHNPPVSERHAILKRVISQDTDILNMGF